MRLSDQYVRVLIIGTHFGMGPVYEPWARISPMQATDRTESLRDSPKTNVFAYSGIVKDSK